MENTILVVIWGLALFHAFYVILGVRRVWTSFQTATSHNDSNREVANWISFVATSIFFLCADIIVILFVFGMKIFWG